jgi:hypothetical protein
MRDCRVTSLSLVLIMLSPEPFFGFIPLRRYVAFQSMITIYFVMAVHFVILVMMMGTWAVITKIF